MQKRFALFLAVLLPLALWAQLTIQVTAIPANTPEHTKIYLAGSFNNWNAQDEAYVLAPAGPGQYSITFNPPAGRIEYKFTRNGWSTVEGNADGKYLPNRIINYSGKPQTERVSIAGWEDRDAGGGGTAAPNVFVLDNNFYIPQLKRNRRIWVYLPPDYATTSKRYPVLYMHDGQNLFDNETSSFGEWQVDEALNKLFNQGDYGCIVIGIDNGGTHRLDEYSPWKNPEEGAGGEGGQYLDFLVKTLKPYVDATYRTLPGPQTTGTMGSSMGGLMAMYTFADRQDVFGKAGVFSPAFWFGGTGPVDDVRAHPKQADVRVYFLAGGDEPDYVEQDMLKVGNAMLSAGFSPGEVTFKVPKDGQHSEWFWRREFPAAYKWLFSGAVSTGKKRQMMGYDLKLSYDSTSVTARLDAVGAREKIEVKIVGATGKLWLNAKQRGGAIPLGTLPKGEYSVLVKRKGKDWEMGELVKP